MTATALPLNRTSISAITSARVPAIALPSLPDSHRPGGGSLLAAFVGGTLLVVGLLGASVAIGAAGFVLAFVALLASTVAVVWTMSRLLDDDGAPSPETP
jgi:hypothetical protein